MISSILLFLISYPFAGKYNKKLNAVGISSLPAAIRAYRTTNADSIKRDVKRKICAYLISLFHCSAVFSGLFGRYPRLIQAHAIVGIGASVRDSIMLRKQKEEEARLEAERRAAEQARGGSMSRWIKGWIFGSTVSSKIDDDCICNDNKNSRTEDGNKKDDEKGGSSAIPQTTEGLKESLGIRKRFSFGKEENAENKSAVASSTPAPSATQQPLERKVPKPKGCKTAKAQSAVKRTKSIIKGKRDSTTDDIIWGAFQASFVLLDQTIGKALAYAWLLFLLTVLEEALLNTKLNKGQKLRRLGWIVICGYYSGKLVLPDWNAIAEGNKKIRM